MFAERGFRILAERRGVLLLLVGRHELGVGVFEFAPLLTMDLCRICG